MYVEHLNIFNFFLVGVSKQNFILLEEPQNNK